MKEVIAIIRLNKTKETKTALSELGLPAFTAFRAAGRGASQRVPNISPDPATQDSRGPRLFPKRLISLVVPDDMVGSVVKAIIRVNQTGAPGDGKIFVLPVAETWRIRTGERGPEAIL